MNLSLSDTITLNIDAAVVATLSGTQTLTNKSLTAPILTGSSSAAGSILFKEDTDNGTNAVTLIGPASTADVTVTLPASAGTVALTSDITVTETSSVALSNKTLTSPVLNGTLSGTAFLDEDSFSSNSATAVASQQSIKAYVDANSGGASSLNGLSDATISSANAGQVLLHDGTDSFDNKDIDFFGTTLNYTAKLALFMGGHIYTVASVDGSSHYVFSGYIIPKNINSLYIYFFDIFNIKF